jgi:hypothetical protein
MRASRANVRARSHAAPQRDGAKETRRNVFSARRRAGFVDRAPDL